MKRREIGPFTERMLRGEVSEDELDQALVSIRRDVVRLRRWAIVANVVATLVNLAMGVGGLLRGSSGVGSGMSLMLALLTAGMVVMLLTQRLLPIEPRRR